MSPRYSCGVCPRVQSIVRCACRDGRQSGRGLPAQLESVKPCEQSDDGPSHSCCVAANSEWCGAPIQVGGWPYPGTPITVRTSNSSGKNVSSRACLLYTSDAADERS